ncbi:MAG: RNA helicase [Methanomicrobiales archaeon HGW-Methanomicrobiales-4]|nr:MAG: RNA helicase [Methanomicrobiales archaeon HGW-Methanomicrobiales-4]
MIASRARLRYHRQIGKLVGYRLPEGAFHGAVIEALFSIPYDAFDRSTREQIMAFLKAFVQCRCQDQPLCGCPERKFAIEVIELRESGLDHRHISEFLLDEYGIEIYAADLLSYLEESVHLLEAIRDVSEQTGVHQIRMKTEDHIEAIEKGIPISG